MYLPFPTSGVFFLESGDVGGEYALGITKNKDNSNNGERQPLENGQNSNITKDPAEKGTSDRYT